MLGWQEDSLSTTSLKSGRLQLIEVAAEGPIATVWRGHDTRLDAPVAIKVLRAELARQYDLRAMFLAEAQTLTRLDYPYIVKTLEVGEEGAHAYLVSEWVDGGTLEQWLARYGTMAPQKAVKVARAVLGALAVGHYMGVLHRGIKASNVLISRRGKPRLADFAMARVHAQHDPVGRREGTGPWASTAPEQRRDFDGSDPRSDLYSVGALLHRLVTGRVVPNLFAAEVEPDLLRGVPGPLVPVVARATRYKPEDRYPSAKVMLKELADLEGSLAAQPLAPSAPTEDDDGSTIPIRKPKVGIQTAVLRAAPGPAGEDATDAPSVSELQVPRAPRLVTVKPRSAVAPPPAERPRTEGALMAWEAVGEPEPTEVFQIEPAVIAAPVDRRSTSTEPVPRTTPAIGSPRPVVATRATQPDEPSLGPAMAPVAAHAPALSSTPANAAASGPSVGRPAASDPDDDDGAWADEAPRRSVVPLAVGGAVACLVAVAVVALWPGSPDTRPSEGDASAPGAAADAVDMPPPSEAADLAAAPKDRVDNASTATAAPAAAPDATPAEASPAGSLRGAPGGVGSARDPSAGTPAGDAGDPPQPRTPTDGAADRTAPTGDDDVGTAGGELPEGTSLRTKVLEEMRTEAENAAAEPPSDDVVDPRITPQDGERTDDQAVETQAAPIDPAPADPAPADPPPVDPAHVGPTPDPTPAPESHAAPPPPPAPADGTPDAAEG